MGVRWDPGRISRIRSSDDGDPADLCILCGDWIVSSRKIEKATYESIPFRVLTADQHPDHDTIAEFRRRHLEALEVLFVQVLRLCRKAGLVKLGHVSLDGTKKKDQGDVA
jgi:transposase